MSLIDNTGKTIIIRCNICSSPMVAAKTDAELFLCFNCNTRITKSEIPISIIVEPKSKSHITNTRDPFHTSGDPRNIIVEPEDSYKNYTLMSESIQKQKRTEDNPELETLSDLFRNKLDATKIEIKYDKHKSFD